MKLNIKLLILLGIFVIAFILRFYKLGDVPNGLYQDETSIGYNAYSIMTTGKDEYGKIFPLYFKSFGDYKLPIYIYSAIIPIKLFGLNAFAVRFPSAFFGFLTVVMFYFFIKEITDKKNLALVATFLLTINPWHLHYSRATFEVSISLFLFIVGTYLLSRAFKKGKSIEFFVGTCLFILCIYTYNLTRLLSPILYFSVILIYKNELKKISKGTFIISTIFSIFLLTPFIISFISGGGISSALGTLIFSSAAVKAPLLELRSYFINIPPIISKLFFSINAMILLQYLQNIASYFSINFFFITGSLHGNHGIGNVGQFYLFELPLFIYGLILSLKHNSWGKIFVLWGIITILVAGATREVPHATRSFFLVVPIIVCIALGVLAVWKKIISIKISSLRIGILAICLAFAFYNIIYYFASYYIRFPIAYAKAWRTTDKELSLFLAQNEIRYDKIIFDKDAGFIYSSMLFYSKYPPLDFQKTSMREADTSEGFSNIKSFGKYEFRTINWDKDIKIPNALIITDFLKKPKDLSALTIFYYPLRPIVLAVEQKIISYPFREPSYVVYETH